MTPQQRLRRALAKLILRGPIANQWIQCKARILEKRFCAELVTASSQPRVRRAFQPAKNGMPLRRLLFIADIMWEANDLIPELQNICPVTALDLKPALQKNAGRVPNSEVVTAAVRAFQEENRPLEPDLIFLYARPSLLSEEIFNLLRQRWSSPLI